MKNRRSVKVISKPVLTPISLTDLKTFLKIDGNDEDDLLTMIIQGCVDMAQIYCERYFLPHTILLTLDYPPCYSNDYDLRLGEGIHDGYKGFYNGKTFIDLPYAPALTITSVKTYNEANVEAVYDPSNYRLDTVSARLYLNEGRTWPSSLRDYESVKIEYTAGYSASPSDVPAGLRLALLAFCEHAYECRGDCTMTDEMQAKFSMYKNYDKLGWVD